MRLKARLALILSLALVLPLLHAAAAQAAADHTITLTDTSGPQSWDGAAATGLNQEYDSASGTPCPETPSGPEDYCEQTLLHVNVSEPADVEVTMDNDPANDFDMYVYASDPDGNRGVLIDSSAGAQTLFEAAQIPAATGHYLIQVVYFQTIESGYGATAQIVEGPPEGNDFFFHAGGEIVNQADKILTADPFFDTSPPTSDLPSLGPDTTILINTGPAGIGDVTWSGVVPSTIETLEIHFWQKSPVQEAVFGDATWELSLFVGAQKLDFPAFTADAPLLEIPTEVRHVFTPLNSGGILPLDPTGQTVTVNLQGNIFDAAPLVVYDSVDFQSGFSINVDAPQTRLPFPPDVDEPAGLQEFLASDPSLGFTSRSEPHIAQNPLDPNMLIAGSKFYNRDPDALAEYEFKIGTYVSFDGGRTWADLGQLAVCPLSEAPPESWPANTCYPEDDPGAEGPEEDGPDVAEEYITSDVWVNFDDEGNAYVMVLDHPPFDGAGEGTGWGMTLHRWDSVSPEDLVTGETWSDRLPINAYPDDPQQSLFLDDKNTFAVNNAGPDGDGQTGTMIACWGQTLRDPVLGAGKQQIVCERSTDGGLTWPDDPLPISDAQALVIGVHVVGDTQDPDTFYATWLQYATGGAGGNLGGALTPETLEFAVTTDGGQTWIHRQAPITTVTQIPRQFPGQAFRNLSIPIMAVGPDGEIYITYADYRTATDPDADEDGMEADIVLVKSTDGGLTWSSPAPVNATGESPNPNADQFQPYVAVTESGQVNVVYFDRRLDPPVFNGEGEQIHTGNYFTDVFLARSNDGGATFTEHRLTHDATDPEFNAPVSPSGLFFGDYQGLVADECFAIPFFNDTHLANDGFLDPGPVRDPEFDDGLPSSPYQESVAWRVPNTATFGGTDPEGCTAPDLTLSSNDISFKNGKGGVRITARIHNVGDAAASGVVVRFSTQNGTLGDATIAQIAAGASQTATISVPASAVKRKTVTVTVDPDDLIAESDETNNSASRQHR